MIRGDPLTRRPPSEVGDWMSRFGGSDAHGGVRQLQAAGLRALQAALGRLGRSRDREGAFALLAADGLFTRAVEAAAEAQDPHVELHAILSAVAGALPEERG